VEEVKSRWTVNANNAVPGVQVIDNAHTDFISSAVFSPDCSAIGTASYDGSVQFHQVHI